MEYKYLNHIESPADLKKVPRKDLPIAIRFVYVVYFIHRIAIRRTISTLEARTSLLTIEISSAAH